METAIPILTEEFPCVVCNGTEFNIFVLIADVVPYKVLFVNKCPTCKTNNKYIYDMIELDYGITVIFVSKDINHIMDRMCFINTGTLVKISRDEDVLFEFRTEDSFVDSINTLLERSLELFDIAIEVETESGKDVSQMYAVKEELNKIYTDGTLKLELVDETGYSRICTQNIEYSEIQNVKVDDLMYKNSDG